MVCTRTSQAGVIAARARQPVEQQPRPPPPPAQHHQQQVGQQRQHHVERDFDCQTPHLGQRLMQIGKQVVVGVDLRQREIAEQAHPGVAGIRPGGAEVVDEIGHQHRDDVGGHDAAHPMPGVPAHRWRCPPVAVAFTHGPNSRNPDSTKKIGTPISMREYTRPR